MNPVKVQKMYPDVEVPAYQTENAAAVDLKAYILDRKPIVIYPGKTRLVGTGLKISIPVGYEGQIRPRSGLSLKSFLRIANSPGTIDADYRGEVGIICHNTATTDIDVAVVINHGDRIAQLVICPVVQAEFKVVENLDETERGEGGFGSTGVK